MSVGSRFNKYGTAPPDITDKIAEEAFQQMQAIFKDVEFNDRHMISKEDLMIRFLIARKYKVADAAELLKNYLEWRKVQNVENIFSEKFDAGIPASYPCSFAGRCKQDHVVYVEQPDQSNIRQLMNQYSMDQLLRWHIYVMERIRERVKAFGTDRVTVILDCRGIGVSVLADLKALNFLKTMAQTDQVSFPENMRKLFVVNAPMAFSTIWKMVKPLLDERTQKKVHIIGKDFQKVLLEHIDMGELPADYGGSGPRLEALSHDPTTYKLPATATIPIAASEEGSPKAVQVSYPGSETPVSPSSPASPNSSKTGAESTEP